jgi:diguanylate cyclase (GGDEF)-like protein
MNLRNKVILLPTIIMLAIFVVGMISIEFYLKNELTKNLQTRLQDLSAFSLAAIELIDNPSPETINPKFDLLADQIGNSNNIRVTFIAKNGAILGDSELPLHELAHAENHSERPEIINAIKFGTGSSIRYSQTLAQNMAYFASYDAKSGYIARVALNSNIYHHTIINLRWRFTIISIITIIVMVIFGIFSMRLITKAVDKEREAQTQVLAKKTREITLIQTLSTMLNGLTCIFDANRVISNILPKLLPNYSGAIFLQEENNRLLQQLSHWGKNWSDDISVPSRWRQKIASEIELIVNDDLHIINNVIYAGLKTQDTDLGVIYLISPTADISETEQQLLKNITLQISLALVNLSVKDQLRNQAIRDPLTNLYNRRFMFETFEQAINRAERHNNSLAVLMIDIDDFKKFNDIHGHDAGDHVLIEIAHILNTKSRLEDIACRLGGEEFCIICPDSDLKSAYALAEKIREYINNLSVIFDNNILGNITISTGISIYPIHGKDIHALLKNADLALYSAKDKGRNITVISEYSAAKPLTVNKAT